MMHTSTTIFTNHVITIFIFAGFSQCFGEILDFGQSCRSALVISDTCLMSPNTTSVSSIMIGHGSSGAANSSIGIGQPIKDVAL